MAPSEPAARDVEPRETVGLDRILFFSDAVVAIAITLLVLPLVDAAIGSASVETFLAEQGFPLVAAAVSFVSIAGSWRANHRLFRGATGYTEPVVTVAFAWLASIVALPIATALIVIGGKPDRLALAMYLAVMTLAPLLTRVQHALLRHAGLIDEPAPTALERVDEWLPIGLHLVAIALILAVPEIGLYSLLVLVLGRVFSVVTRMRHPRADG